MTEPRPPIKAPLTEHGHVELVVGRNAHAVPGLHEDAVGVVGRAVRPPHCRRGMDRRSSHLVGRRHRTRTRLRRRSPCRSLSKLRMYVPLPGFAANAMPPDCAAIPPSHRTGAHRITAPPAGRPVRPALARSLRAGISRSRPRGTWPRLKSPAGRSHSPVPSSRCSATASWRHSRCLRARSAAPGTRPPKPERGRKRLNRLIPSPRTSLT